MSGNTRNKLHKTKFDRQETKRVFFFSPRYSDVLVTSIEKKVRKMF